MLAPFGPPTIKSLATALFSEGMPVPLHYSYVVDFHEVFQFAIAVVTKFSLI